MRRLLAALAVTSLLGGCSGGAPDARPTNTASPGGSSLPRASPTPRPKPPASPSRSPSPTPSPAPTGVPVDTSGTALRLVTGGEVKTLGPDADDCAALYPELLDVSCDDVKLDGGSLLWVAGTEKGRWTLRLLTFEEAAGGYRLRYRADDPGRTWSGFRIGATPLAGSGTDGLVAATLLAGATARRAYDVLTWRAGGPLVLRARRPPLQHGRVLLAKGRVDEYAALYAPGDATCCPSRFVYRRLLWDGRRFVLQTVGPVPAGKAPAAD